LAASKSGVASRLAAVVSDCAHRDRGALRLLFLIMRHVDGGKPPDDANRREAEIADAKESLKAKLDAMAERARRTPGLRRCVSRAARADHAVECHRRDW
jgi:hypothetical protein